LPGFDRQRYHGILLKKTDQFEEASESRIPWSIEIGFRRDVAPFAVGSPASHKPMISLACSISAYFSDCPARRGLQPNSIALAVCRSRQLFKPFDLIPVDSGAPAGRR